MALASAALGTPLVVCPGGLDAAAAFAGCRPRAPPGLAGSSRTFRRRLLRCRELARLRDALASSSALPVPAVATMDEPQENLMFQESGFDPEMAGTMETGTPDHDALLKKAGDKKTDFSLSNNTIEVSRDADCRRNFALSKIQGTEEKGEHFPQSSPLVERYEAALGAIASLKKTMETASPVNKAVLKVAVEKGVPAMSEDFELPLPTALVRNGVAKQSVNWTEAEMKKLVEEEKPEMHVEVINYLLKNYVVARDEVESIDKPVPPLEVNLAELPSVAERVMVDVSVGSTAGFVDSACVRGHLFDVMFDLVLETYAGSFFYEEDLLERMGDLMDYVIERFLDLPVFRIGDDGKFFVPLELTNGILGSEARREWGLPVSAVG